jgi:hypothetical protein
MNWIFYIPEDAILLYFLSMTEEQRKADYRLDTVTFSLRRNMQLGVHSLQSVMRILINKMPL